MPHGGGTLYPGPLSVYKMSHRNPDKDLKQGSRHTSGMVAVGEVRRYGEICKAIVPDCGKLSKQC